MNNSVKQRLHSGAVSSRIHTIHFKCIILYKRKIDLQSIWRKQTWIRISLWELWTQVGAWAFGIKCFSSSQLYIIIIYYYYYILLYIIMYYYILKSSFLMYIIGCRSHSCLKFHMSIHIMISFSVLMLTMEHLQADSPWMGHPQVFTLILIT